MPRVIAVGPGGRAQAPARDDRYGPVLGLVRELGWHDGRNILSPVCVSHDQADDVRRGLYRAARYFCSCGERNCTRKNKQDCPAGGQRLSMRADIVRDGKRLRIQFRVFDKQEARRAIIAKYGPDPSKWPYFAKARQLDKEFA